jgi:DNA mismatch repair protein MutL
MGIIHQIVLSEKRKNKTKSRNSQSLLFSLEYHLNEIEKNKYRSKKSIFQIWDLIWFRQKN